MKLLTIFILYVSILTCQQSKKIEYHKGFELLWIQEQSNWNGSSLTLHQDFLYGLTLDDSIFKVALHTGKIEWIKPAAPNYHGQKPLVIENKIFVAGRGKIISYDLTGQLLWSKNTDRKIVHTLIAYDSLLLGSMSSRGLFAFNQVDGAIAWKNEPDWQLLTSGTPGIKDSFIVIDDFGYLKKNANDVLSYLCCINANNGNYIWKIPKNPFLFSSEPEIIGDIVYINFDSGYAAGYTKAIDINSGELLWENKNFPYIFRKPLYFNNRLFTSSYEKGLICLDAKTGKTIWINELKGTHPTTNIILYNDMLAFGTEKGAFYLIDLEGKTVFESNFLGFGDPFIYKDTLYVTGGGTLYKFINAP